ncbi:hypothetical protein GCM10027299_21960 [Larkinella ripae]
MKILYVLLFGLLTIPVFGQKAQYTLEDMPFDIDSVTKGIVFKGVVQVPGATAEQLYTRAKAFVFRTFMNADAVIQVDDKPGGLLAGKGLLRPAPTVGNMLLTGDLQYYTPFEIRVKDGRYRYEIANIQMIANGMRMGLDQAINSGSGPRKTYNERQYQRMLKFTTPFVNLIEDLQIEMEKKSGKEDW